MKATTRTGISVALFVLILVFAYVLYHLTRLLLAALVIVAVLGAALYLVMRRA